MLVPIKDPEREGTPVATPGHEAADPAVDLSQAQRRDSDVKVGENGLPEEVRYGNSGSDDHHLVVIDTRPGPDDIPPNQAAPLNIRTERSTTTAMIDVIADRERSRAVARTRASAAADTMPARFQKR
jgi:hypothetical protein